MCRILVRYLNDNHVMMRLKCIKVYQSEIFATSVIVQQLVEVNHKEDLTVLYHWLYVMEIKPLNLMWLVDILRKNVFDAEF